MRSRAAPGRRRVLALPRRHVRHVGPDAELQAAAALYQLVANVESRNCAAPEVTSGQASIPASAATSVST